jgi:hypothetical protein
MTPCLASRINPEHEALRVLGCGLLLALLVGCNGSSQKGAPAEATANPHADAASPHGADPDAAAPGGEGDVKPLAFNGQPGWVSEPPSTEMRVAQWKLPKAEKDPEDGTLVIYYFGGGGGRVNDNLARWSTQFDQPDGRDSIEVAAISEAEVNGMTVHRMDLSGTYVAETTPGSGVRLNKPDFRLLGAIVESPAGLYFIKLIGPKATVVRWQESFEKFIGALKP